MPDPTSFKSAIVTNRRRNRLPDGSLPAFRRRRAFVRPMRIESLESRRMLSATPGWNMEPPSFGAGEFVIGFEGEVAAAFEMHGEVAALEMAQRIVGNEMLHTGRILFGSPPAAERNARVATLWQLTQTADVQQLAEQLSRLSDVAYAEPNTIMTGQSIPGDASFVGDWPFGVQEHLTRIGAPDAWDVTTGDPSVVVAVVDTGVDLDHPDLNDNLLAGTTFVEGTTTPQDDNGHGTAVAGLIAAEMNNLTELAAEANGDPVWAGGVVGVAPSVSILPVKVLNQDSNGRVSDIAAGINYAVNPDGDPATDDGADIIALSLSGSGFSQVVSDAIANAYRQGVLVIASVSPQDWSGSYPAMDPYALAVTAVDADDVWDGDHATGSFVDIAAQGVNVLTTFVDPEDPSQAVQFAGAYGRESGSSLSTPIVAGAAALIKSLHPDWGPSEIAGQLLATADSIDAMNPDLQNQLGAGRVSASAAVGPTAEPRVITLGGLGEVAEDPPTLSLLRAGDPIDVRFSHAMDPASVLDASNYQLTFLNDPADDSDDQAVEVSLVTQPLPPNSAGVSDSDSFYFAFPGRGVRLQVEGISGIQGTRLPAGAYRLTIGSMTSIEGRASAPFSHDFQIATPVPFGDRHLICCESYSWSTFEAADMDGDGDLDLLSYEGRTGKIAWWDNIDGKGNFGPRRMVPTTAPRQSVWRNLLSATDLDGDGDVDVLAAFPGENTIAWYENSNGTGVLWVEHIITKAGPETITMVTTADLDGDGNMDVIAKSGDKIIWYENTGAASFDEPQSMTGTGDVNEVKFISTADLDGDGDLDLLSASWLDHKVAWYENTDGMGTFGPQLLVTPTLLRASYINAADLDGDGDLDVLAHGQGKTVWFENADGAGHFGPQQVIDTSEEFVDAIIAGDLDRDGDLDLLIAGQDQTTWYKNTDGEGTFSPQQRITDEYRCFLLADLDGDEDPDVVASNAENVVWLENQNNAANFAIQTIESYIALQSAISVHAADLDGDGDLDALSASQNRIAWYENTDGLGNFGTLRLITTMAYSGQHVSTADLDGDGDLDVLSASAGDDKIAWYENLDGKGGFGSQQVITTNARGARDVHAADLDGDGDLDVLSASYADNKIAWYENLDGKGGFGSQQVITTNARDARDVHAADLDGDGDLDVLSASAHDYKTAWYENLDGAGTFGTEHVIANTCGWSVDVADLDGDDDLDVVAGGVSNSRVEWYENLNGQGEFDSPQLLVRHDGEGYYTVLATDLDNDGDLDVLSGSRYTSDSGLYWSENIDGAGEFGLEMVVDVGRPHSSLFTGDVDADGDLDLFTTSGGIIWYENLMPHPGDANRDGRFNTADLVQVLQAGEYEDDVQGNSTWEEGDWNGDREFDTADLVLALQKGLYELKAGLNASRIAAAVDWLFAQNETQRRGRAFVA